MFPSVRCFGSEIELHQVGNNFPGCLTVSVFMNLLLPFYRRVNNFVYIITSLNKLMQMLDS